MVIKPDSSSVRMMRPVVVTARTTARTARTTVVRMDPQGWIQVAKTVPRSAAGSRTGRTQANCIQRSSTLTFFFLFLLFFQLAITLISFRRLVRICFAIPQFESQSIHPLGRKNSCYLSATPVFQSNHSTNNHHPPECDRSNLISIPSDQDRDRFTTTTTTTTLLELIKKQENHDVPKSNLVFVRPEELASIIWIRVGIDRLLFKRPRPHGRVDRVGSQTAGRLDGRQHVQGFGSAEGGRAKRRRRRLLRLVFQVPLHLVTSLQRHAHNNKKQTMLLSIKLPESIFNTGSWPIDDWPASRTIVQHFGWGRPKRWKRAKSIGGGSRSDRGDQRNNSVQSRE